MKEKKEEKIEANFNVLDDRGHENDLECPRCGYEFKVDAHTNENLEWDRKKKAFVAKCPLCGTEQE